MAGDSVEEIGIKMTKNCQIVSNWMMGNKLKLNAGKTHLMPVGTGARLKIQVTKVNVKMDGLMLQESNDMF